MATSGSPDDSEECSEDDFNQGTETVPLEEQLYKASRDQLVSLRPKVATRVVDDDREEHGPGRDIADEGLVLGIDLLSLASKRSHGSAEDSPASSDLPPSYNIPSPVRQVSNEEVSDRENQKLYEKIDRLERSNQKLRKEVSDLKAKEQELHLRALELQNKEKEQEIRFQKQKQELQLEKERLELHVRRSESDLQIEKKKLELQKDTLRVREWQVQVEKQEHDQQMKQTWQELLTKERSVRAMTRELQNQQEKNKLYFEAEERDLEIRERTLEVTKKQLKQQMKALKEENSKLREEVETLNCRIYGLLQNVDGGALLSSLTENQRASVNAMLLLSHATGSCGKRCTACAVEESRCGRCGSFRAEHCKSQPCGGPVCPLQHHKYDRAPNSHAYSEKMLFRSCGKSDEALIWDATKDQVRKPSTCTWHLLCAQCERNVSALEGRICKRHDAEYYHNSEKPIPEGHIHQEDVTVLRVFTYRALPLNTDVYNFLVTLNQQESPKVVRVLKTLHQAFDDAKQQCSQPDSSGHLRSCEEGMLFAYDLSDKGHQIEFPFFCEVDLTAAGPGLGHHWLVYGQMPPYYWAFPVDTDKADDLQLHFRSIIKSVNSQLVQEREEYYWRYSEAKEKCSEAKRKCGPIKLIVGYLRRLDKYCIKVRVECD